MTRNNVDIPGITPETVSFVNEAERAVFAKMAETDRIAEYNQYKVLSAMRENKLSETHFAATTGYGYNDRGRDMLETVYASVFRAEAALVRPQLISGTHALAAALFGNLRPGDILFSPMGAPYDTLRSVIGIHPSRGSLAEYGVEYRQAELTQEGQLDFDAIEEMLSPETKMVIIQRSKGYEWRKSFTISEIKELISFIKSLCPSAICMVDNCYGEFVETTEPVEVGADLAVGSLIKNPGGGLAPVGGYIVGKQEYTEAAATRLTAPGLGMEVGPTLGLTSVLLQGLFIAPQVVGGAVKGAVLAAEVFSRRGFSVLPGSTAVRADIVQAIRLGSAERVLSFCRGIQKAAPVDSFVSPEAAGMPGYACPVVMAAGAFVQGSSIELSADAPLKPPYTVYFQGGLTYWHAKAGIAHALEELEK